MGKQKIFLISNMYPSDGNPSFGTFIKTIAEDLENDFVVEKMVPNFNIQSRLVRYLAFWIKVILRGLRIKKDVVYCHYCSHSFPALVVLFFLGRLQRLVVHIHGSEITREHGVSYFKSKIKLYVTGLAVRKAIICVVPSKYYYDKVVSLWPKYRCKIVISPSGGVPIPCALPSNFTNTWNPLKMVYVGRLVEDKGVITMCEAIRRVIDNIDKQITLTIIGDGPLRSIISRYGFVEIIGSFEHSMVMELIRDNSILVFPSERESESLGLVGIEGMANGLIVVSSDVGGPSTYIEDQNTGFLFKAGSSESLAATLLAVIKTNPRTLIKVRENAYRRAQEYDSHKVGSKFRKIILDAFYGS